MKDIVSSLMNNPNYNFSIEAERVDEIIFDLYNISVEIKKEISNFYANIMDFA